METRPPGAMSEALSRSLRWETSDSSSRGTACGCPESITLETPVATMWAKISARSCRPRSMPAP